MVTKEYNLKRCPCCGGEAALEGGASFYWVYCTECKIETKAAGTKPVAVALWNRRVNNAIDVDKVVSWLASYSILDTRPVYTQGELLVPMSRVEDALHAMGYEK